jgi:small-conductance mechanosensitive channel
MSRLAGGAFGRDLILMLSYRALALRIGVVASALWLLAAVPSPAQDLSRLLTGRQDTTQDTVPADSVRVAPDPLPLEAVPIAADQTESALRAMTATLTPTSRFTRIEDDLIDEVAELNRRGEELRALDLTDLSFRRLQDLRFGWLRSQDRLGRWKEALSARWRELQEVNDRLTSMRSVWELTEQQALDEQFPAEVQTRIQFVLVEIERTDVQIRDRFSAILGVQNQIAEEERQIATALNTFDQLDASSRSRVLIRDSPPLWKIVGPRGEPGALSAEALEAWRERVAAFDDFVRVQRNDLWFQAGMFIVLLLGLVALRRRVVEWEEGEAEDMQAYRYVLLRPISSAFILALLVAGVLVSGPYVWDDVLMTLLAIPLVRLIPGLVAAPLRPALYGLIGLFVVDRIGDLAPDGSLVQRLNLLVVALLGVVLLLWFLRREEFISWLRTRALSRYGIAAARLAVGLLGTSVVANVFGWVRLSELLNDGVLSSVVLAVAIAVTVTVLIGVIHLLPHTYVGRSLRAIRHHGDLIAGRLTRLVRWLGRIVWIWATLRGFLLWEPVIGWIGRILGRSFTVGFVSISLGGVLSFFAILWGATLLSRFVRFVLVEDILPRFDLRRGVATTVSTLAHWTILGIGLLAAAGAAGLGSGQLTVIAGALGVGIGFGLQGIVNNFVSGLVLIFEQPIKVGDTVEVGTLIGEVRRIGMRASVIRTFDGAEVIVPNANLIAGEVINWTLSDQKRRMDVTVGVKYGTDPEQVLDVLLTVARNHKEVLPYPAPTALFLGFGDSSLDFTLRSWAASFDDFIRVHSELNVRVNAALAEAGIEIPFPQRDLHLRSSSVSLGGSVQLPAAAPQPETSADDD